MALLTLDDPGDLLSPVLVAAFDGWVDAGGAATTAAERLADAARIIATFDGDAIYDYRARRPTLEIVDGQPASLEWPELAVRRSRAGGRDILVLSGPEPDYRWQELARDAITLCEQLGIAQWISLGAIPAAVPHTRPVPVMGTASRPGLLRGDIEAGPAGLLRVPSACLSVIDMAVARSGVPAVGYFAQVPHYVTGPYPAAAVRLLEALGRHLDVALPTGALPVEARDLATRLNQAAALDADTRAYVERLEGMVDEARLPAGDELISDIERFLREQGRGGGRPN